MKRAFFVLLLAPLAAATACGKTLDVDESAPPGGGSPLADGGAASDSSSLRGEPIEISPGITFSCARTTQSGKVYCWGVNLRGAIASGPAQETPCSSPSGTCIPSPTLLGALNDVTKVSVGHTHGCAITKNREVFCFGSNDYGNLGSGAGDGDPHGPTRLADMNGAIDISAGLFGTCALRETLAGSTEVWCWGLKNVGLTGELPLNSAQAQSTPLIAKPAKISGLDGAKKVVVAASFGLACAIDANDHVKCWGLNLRGSLGHAPATPPDVVCGALGGDLAPCRIAPTPVSEDIAVKDLVVGNHFGCVITKADDKAMCWGVNTRKYLGIGRADTNDHPNFEAVSGLPAGAVTSLSATDHHVCVVVASTGAVMCWGEDERLGAMGTCSGESACSVADQRDIDRAWAGSSATYLRRKSDNAILAMGKNHVGQLGRPPGSNGDVPCGDGGMCNSTPQPIVFP